MILATLMFLYMSAIYFCANAISLSNRDKVAAVFMGSQKTMAFGLPLITAGGVLRTSTRPTLHLLLLCLLPLLLVLLLLLRGGIENNISNCDSSMTYNQVDC